MKKDKILNWIFIIITISILFVPFLKLNTTETIVSTIENRILTSWPGLHFTKHYNEWYGHYVEDRVGFRNKAIAVQSAITYYVFGEFSESLHMFGKDDYIFPSDQGYIENYQRININDDLIDDLVTYLARTDAYAKEKGIDFYFMICPNKSSVYDRYMPDNINVDENRLSLLDVCKEKLSEKEIPFLIPDDLLKKQMDKEQVYNVSYDCAHWNDYGAFYSLKTLDQMIAEKHPDIPVMAIEDFNITTENKKIEFITFPIEEEVPIFTLKENVSYVTEQPLLAEIPVEPGKNMSYYYNENAVNDKKILILHDSFLDNKAMWYAYRYQEVYTTTRANYEHMKDYIDKIQPDIIIYENAERSFADDLYAYIKLSEITYDTEVE